MKTWVRFLVVLLAILAAPNFVGLAQAGITFSNGTVLGPINSDEVAFFKNMVMESYFDQSAGVYLLRGDARGANYDGTLTAQFDPATLQVTGQFGYSIYVGPEDRRTEQYGLSGTLSGLVNYVGGVVLNLTGTQTYYKFNYEKDDQGNLLYPDLIEEQEESGMTRQVTFAVSGANLTPSPEPTRMPLEDSGTRFSDMAGTVEVLIPIGVDENGREIYDEQDWQYAQMEMVLPVGTMIKTHPNSVVLLSFADMTTFEQKADSTIILSSSAGKDNQIQLLYGNLMTNVKKMLKDGSMEVECSQAVAGIKGTILVLQDDGATTTLQVIEGTVEFTSKATGQTELVSAGETLAADSSGFQEKTTFDIALETAQWDSLNRTPGASLSPTQTIGIAAMGGGGLLLVLALVLAFRLRRK